MGTYIPVPQLESIYPNSVKYFMTSVILLTLLLLNPVEPKIAPDKILLPVTVDRKIGFINLQGKIVIPPKFHAVGKFSEGLCPARLDGTYGYINTSGEYIIPPTYDYAYDFLEGKANVYDSNGHASSIDHRGNLFPPRLHFDEGFAIVMTESGKTGLMNMNHEIILDTLDKSIYYLNEGLYAVIDNSDFSGFVYDTLGNKLFPIYNTLRPEPFKNGIAEFRSGSNQRKKKLGFIDRTGKILAENDPKYISAKEYIQKEETTLSNLKKKFVAFSGRGFKIEDKKYYIEVKRWDSLFYLTNDGKIIWKEESEMSLHEHDFHFNIDIHKENHYRIADFFKTFRRSEMTMGDISEFNLQKDTSITVIAAGMDRFNEAEGESGEVIAQKFIFANTTSHEIKTAYSPQAIMQAKDRNGEWKDIEKEWYLMCGFGIKLLTIPPGKYVLLAGPIFEGGLKTKLRLKFRNFYSKEFDGSINPAQLWRQY